MRKLINSKLVVAIFITSLLAIASILGLARPVTVLAATAPTLSDMASFAVLGATTVTNTGSSVLNGDLGLYNGTSITGFFGTTANEGPGVVSVGYAVHQTDATANLAQTAATNAYNSMASQSCGGNDLSGQNLGGKTLTPGVYCFTSTAQLTGTLTLNAQGDPNAVWIFQVGTALTIDNSASIVFSNGGTGTPGCNVYWQVGSSATIGTSATFVGTIIANSEAVTLNTNATLYGRAISRIAAVTLDTNTITVPTCAAVAPTCTLSASPGPIDYNGTTAVTWSSTNATACTASGGSTGWTGVSGSSGTWTSGALTIGQTYSMTCTGPGGTSPQCNTAVTVNPAPATLHIIKHVINNNSGSTLAPGFSVHVKDDLGNDVAGSPASPQAGAEDPGTTYTLTAGTYTVSEDANASYVRTFSDDCNTITGIITLAPGDNKTCTITNDDIVPPPPVSRITVSKIVVGGDKLPSDFHMFVDGAPVVRDVANIFSAGAHVVSETADSNYTRTFALDCLDGNVNLIAGDNKTCIITNTYKAPLSGGNFYIPPVPPLIDVVKVPSPLALPVGPGLVTYAYTLRNIGTVPVVNVTMVDDSCSSAILTSGDTNSDNKLDINETWVYHCSTTLSTTHTNTVVATGWANGISAIDIASATVVVGTPIMPPLIHVTKLPSPLTLHAEGGTVTYTYTVTNPGTVPLNNVNITDDKCTGLPGRVVGHPGDINKNNLLESNESWIFTCQSKLTKTITNTATASGEANGLTAKDYAIATVVVAIIPKLPNTGSFFDGNTMQWIVVILIGLFVLISISVALILRGHMI